MTTFVVAVGVLMAMAPSAFAAGVNTSDDPNWNGPSVNPIVGAPTQACANGGAHSTPAINCNIYLQQGDVFLSGSPTSPAPGTYFFAVLDPGGQANPNDGAPDLLSTDAATNREFSVDSNGVLSPLTSTHAYDTSNNVLQVAPFDQTPNHGGEYILAVCQISNSPNDYQSSVPTVVAKDCKYDAFKVQPAGTCTSNCGGGGNFADLGIIKTAVPAFTRTYGWDASKSVDTNKLVTSAGSQAAFNYTVKATWSGPSDGGWDVSGQITVTNPNTEDFPGVTLTDQISDVATSTPDPSSTCTITDTSSNVVSGPVYVPGNSVDTYNYDCKYGTAGPASQFEQNTVTATWDNTGTLKTPDSSASWTVPFTWDDSSTGNPTVQDLCTTVSDDFAGALTPDTLGTVCADGTNPGTNWANLSSAPSYDSASNKWTFQYQRVLSAPTDTCNSYTNTANFNTADLDKTDPTTGDNSQTVQLCGAGDLSVVKSAATSYTRTYAWTIKKSADQSGKVVQSGSSLGVNYSVTASETGFSDSSIQATGTITVSNPNDFESIPLTGVIDHVDNGGSCSFTGGDSPTATVPKGGSVTLDYKCTYADGSLPANGTNTATASWDANAAGTVDGHASGEAAVTLGAPASTVNPAVTPIDKLGSSAAVELCTLDTSGPCTLTASDDASNLTTHTYTYSRTLTGTPGTCTTYDNTAGLQEISTATSTWEVKLCVGADLTVGKTAATSYTRTYKWTVVKSVNKTQYDQLSGSVVPAYKVVVTEGTPSDSSIQATGTITVSNPNDFESITLTGVTDQVDNGGSCSFTNGSTTATVNASSSVTLTYVCTYGSVPASGTNTATATWGKTAAGTPDGSAKGTAAVTFGAPTSTVHKTITPTDTFNGGAAVNLCTLQTGTPCTLTATDPPATPTSQTYTYTRTIAVVQDQCKAYLNTASDGVGDTSQQTVTVCGGVAGGLTMGFWQNKNGQAIITGQASSGACPAAAWLVKLAPFQDLSPTATCSQVASYVYNIIKAADASGAAMNAMLKAQMLATALDVYFSDPALGGNKTGAPAPLGGVKVDLTRICSMLDSSSGTGTCGGTYTNVSSAFGGATELTVLQMLQYAAAQATAATTSNPLASPWYAQNKTTQGLAKNAFDAINNGQAFAGP